MFFHICSGQGKESRTWAVRLADPYYTKAQWWRASDKRGRTRLFGSPEAASHAAIALNNEGWPQELADRGIAP